MAYGYVTFAPTFALATRDSIGRTRPAMDGLASTDSCGDAISHWWRGPAANKVLLMAGVAAVVVYAVGDVLSGLLYDGYSHTDQAISELSAFGSPVRPLMVTAILTHGVLLLAFGQVFSGRLVGSASGGSAPSWSRSASLGSPHTRSGKPVGVTCRSFAAWIGRYR